MALQPMAPGGRWMKPPHDGPPVYVPAKQAEAHVRRLVVEQNWTPCEDPRTDNGMARAPVEAPMTAREQTMQAQIDQLTALVQSLVATPPQKEQDNASTLNHVGSATEDEATEGERQARRSKR